MSELISIRILCDSIVKAVSVGKAFFLGDQHDKPRPPAATKLWHRRPACDPTGFGAVVTILFAAGEETDCLQYRGLIGRDGGNTTLIVG